MWGVLLPAKLLLYPSEHSRKPQRVLSLVNAAVVPRGGSSLTLTIQSTRWQFKLAARDHASYNAWLAAFEHALPVEAEAAVTEPAQSTPGRVRAVSTNVAASFTELLTALSHTRVLATELRAGEAALTEAQRTARSTLEKMEAQLSQPRTLSLLSLSPFRTPSRGNVLSTSSSCSSRGASTLSSAPGAEQLRQLRLLNNAIRTDIHDKVSEIRRMQRAVVAMSANSWSWHRRLRDGSTLWENWRRAVTLHSLHKPRQPEEKPQQERGAIAADVAEGIWSIWTNRYGVRSDPSDANSALSRRQAHEDGEEDWFISIANKVFEV